MVGRQNVGKSTLGHVFAEGTFDPTIPTTVAMDFFSKTIQLPEYNNHKIRLQIWDSAGQERYKSIITSYLRDVYIAFVTFDVTNRDSWNQVDMWRSLVLDQSGEFIPHIVLVGTKSDKKNHTVSHDEVIEKAKKWKCNYYILSSKQNNSAGMIYRMFYIEAEKLHRDIVYNHINGKELPVGVLEKDNEKRFKIFTNNNDNYDDEDNGWCCFQ